ncbi:hypothetical protein Q1695_005805 [Nippostrongylus brasiliensis]|nr:hypothetical protein Q1695_005805 [Nippostrongylus brasiliensis]
MSGGGRESCLKFISPSSPPRSWSCRCGAGALKGTASFQSEISRFLLPLGTRTSNKVQIRDPNGAHAAGILTLPIGGD